MLWIDIYSALCCGSCLIIYCANRRWDITLLEEDETVVFYKTASYHDASIMEHYRWRLHWNIMLELLQACKLPLKVAYGVSLMET